MSRTRIRCAIYTRKSSEEGLEQDFNSLAAQREACEAYIASQKAEGWVVLPDRYDDGGLSGGTLDRPALQTLLAEVDAGRIDRIVVYKIDRLTRMLSDFARIVDRLEAGGASFVSVTQSFDTATSMGRLTLNMLLSFAQFEREMTAERIRDKIRASKRRGLWMGGSLPIGYRPDGRSLAIIEDEASFIRRLYDLYRHHKTLSAVVAAAAAEGLCTPRRISAAGRCTGGEALTKSRLHRLLTNPVYAGRIRHHAQTHPGLHDAIIAPQDWDDVQASLQSDAARTRGDRNGAVSSPLKGKLRDVAGDTLTPTQTTRNGRRHRYYISRCLVSERACEHPDAWRLAADPLERTVRDILCGRLRDPAFLPALCPDADGALLLRIGRVVAELAQTTETDPSDAWTSMIEIVDLSHDALTIRMDAYDVAERIGLPPAALDPEALVVTSSLRLRRRGAETRLVVGNVAPQPDVTLIRNILRARSWYARIRAGASLGDIARQEKLPRSRIQHLLDLAFLSPDLLHAIADGTQPTGLTTEWVKRHSLPADWTDQRAAVSTL